VSPHRSAGKIKHTFTSSEMSGVDERWRPVGVIVQFGGQTPLNLSLPLKAAGVNIIGTSPESIDLAEDRKRFGKLSRNSTSARLPAQMVTSPEEAVEAAKKIGFPVLVRPSYVLGGRAMVIRVRRRFDYAIHEAGGRIFAGSSRF